MNLLPSRFYLDDFFNSSKKEYMKCDIYEEGNHYVIEMDIPGFQKEDIQIELENNYLTILVEKSEEQILDKTYLRKERSYENCERSFYVGDINLDEVTASFQDGVLKVIFPQKQKEVSKKNIPID